MTTVRIKIIDTNGIPQCPHCKRPTRRTGGMVSVTAAYYAPIFDEFGHNTNPDRNVQTSHWECYECKNNYTVKGNAVDGYYYA